MLHRAWPSLAAACLLSACSDNDAASVPAVPVEPATNVETMRDAGPRAMNAGSDAEDAGAEDLGPVLYCARVTAPSVSEDGSRLTTTLKSPSDLVLTRQAESWSTDCSDPRLEIELSDGVCPLGRGHALRFSFGYRELLSGAIHTGNNGVGSEEETPAISVRYTRPSRLTPHGVWGTCAGASGQIIFAEEPIIRPGAEMSATFFLNLTACDDSGARERVVEGSFRLQLRTLVTDACPDGGF